MPGESEELNVVKLPPTIINEDKSVIKPSKYNFSPNIVPPLNS